MSIRRAATYLCWDEKQDDSEGAAAGVEEWTINYFLYLASIHIQNLLQRTCREGRSRYVNITNITLLSWIY